MTGAGLCLVAHASTPALRRATFGAGTGGAADTLDGGGRRAASRLAADPVLAQVETWLAAPSRTGPARCTGAAVETARVLAGRDVVLEPALADCDYGAWTGRTFEEVAGAEPDGVRVWLTDPDAAPHGGESVTAFVRRVGAWLDGYAASARQAADARRTAAVVHPAVVRAAVVHVMRAPVAAFTRLDVAPLAVLRLRGDRNGWRLALPGSALRR